MAAREDLEAAVAEATQAEGMAATSLVRACKLLSSLGAVPAAIITELAEHGKAIISIPQAGEVILSLFSSKHKDSSRTTSLELASTMGDTSSTGTEGSHTDGNTSDGMRSTENNSPRTDKHFTINITAAPAGAADGTPVDSSTQRNVSDGTQEHKKVLGFIYVFAEKLPYAQGVLTTASLACILGDFGNQTWMKRISAGSGISFICSLWVAGFAGSFKEGESTDNNGFGIFIWAVFLMVQGHSIVVCVTLHVVADIPFWFVWVIGTTNLCFAAGTWVIYLKAGKFLKEWAKAVFEFLVQMKDIISEKMG